MPSTPSSNPARRVVPAILTCDRNGETFGEFVQSFLTVADGLERPVVLVDTSATGEPSREYLSLVDSLRPRVTHIHPRQTQGNLYESIQHGAQELLECVLGHTDPDDLVLFIEDDVLFSSRFLDALRREPLPTDAGFVTFYLPEAGYGGREVDPEGFYGTQCVLFPRHAVSEIVASYDYITQHFRPGFDIRWSRFLAERGYRLYCSDRSYVQHIGNVSRMSSDAVAHRSHLFAV